MGNYENATICSVLRCFRNVSWVYKTVALPLSYIGKLFIFIHLRLSRFFAGQPQGQLSATAFPTIIGPMQRKQSKRPAWPYVGRNRVRMTAYGNGQWGKKIGGRVFYFGVWADPAAALAKYNQEHGEIRKTGQRGTTMLSVDEMVNLFLDAKDAMVQKGELTVRTYADYRAVCSFVKMVLGADADVEQLTPADFSELSARLVAGPVRRANEITWIRGVFKWAYDSDLIEKPVRFGPQFVRPPVRLARKLKREKQKKLYTAPQLRRLFLKAPTPLKAMILLAINGGYGNSDCATLPKSGVNLRAGIIDYARPKTEVERTVPLWRETVAALRRADLERPKASLENEGLFFVTHHGNAWVRSQLAAKSQTIMDAIAWQFELTCRGAGVKNLGFYAIRHTFRTVADATLDQHAIHRIMGHSLPGLSAAYVEHISMERLRAVVEYVRRWFRRGDDKGGGGGRVGVIPSAGSK